MKTLALIFVGIIGLAAALPELECPRPEWKKRRTNNHCYWFELDDLPQFKADERCRRYDGKLVTIDDQAENDWILKEVLPPTPTAASGLVGEGSSEYFYIGLKRDDTDEMRWELDGSLLSWAAPWIPGEPDNYRNKENCFVYYEKTGEWADKMCGDNYYFICEYEIPEPPPTAPPTAAH